MSEQKQNPAATPAPPNGAAPADAANANLVPGPDGTMMTKTAAKKAAKEAEKAQKKAAQGAIRAQKQQQQQQQQQASGSGGAKNQGAKKKESQPEEVWVNNTKPGEKKDLSAPMASGYNPDHVEQSWFQWWEKSGFYSPRPVTDKDPHDPQKTFVIPIPPPNVTGALHIGHALTLSIQDCLIRWYRMRGYRALYTPGYDHAGIATQAVVEKRLAKLEGKTRYDYGREGFLEKVFTWKEEYQTRIRNQVKRLGASCDFTREAFTMDEQRSRAVSEAFCRLYDDGIIYRGTRLVNWCCKLNTTLSNLEVEQKQLNGRTLMNVPGYDVKERIEFGVIVSFAYRVVDSDERIVVATTRPETMLGDTAVAVHPSDARYKHLHGKLLQHPFIEGRRIPVVTDDVAVDMEFGTGAVKITPAHDPNDYEVGVRHKLEFINILNDDGTLNDSAGQFKGMKRFSARRAVIEALKAKDLYVETKDNPMTVPVCSRSGDIVEPVIKPQWWVDCKPLAKQAVEAVQRQGMVIVPEASRKEFFHWMETIQDWCISRQLWWGHRVPAYFVDVEGQESQRDDPKSWVVGRNEAEARERAAKLLGAGAKFTLHQDEDVLDTWFSSALWPFSTVGWPTETSEDLARFFPASMLETGWDILFFWVARMVMMGVHLTGKIPFREVFCHAMVRDAHGRKMSKSLGNVIDPLDVIAGIKLEGLHAKLREGNLDEKEIAKAAAGQKKDFPKGIPQCGSDALRFALCAYTSAGRDINLDIGRVEGYRKFCNKLWNATRFALLKLEGDFVPAPREGVTGRESLVERWILHRLDAAARQVNEDLSRRNFMSATTAAYDFWLYELCDVYIEAIKPTTDPNAADVAARRSAQETLYTCLESGFRLLHPFMPFVTEELWQRLPRRAEEASPTVSLTAYPEADEARRRASDAARFDDVMAAVRASRSLASDFGLTSGVQLYLETPDAKVAELLAAEADVVKTLVKGCESVEVVLVRPASANAAAAAGPTSAAATTTDEAKKAIPPGCAVVALGAQRINVHLAVRGKVDLDAELAKLAAKLELVRTGVDKARAAMSPESADEWNKKPESVRQAAEQRLEALQAELGTLESARRNLEQLK